MTLNFSWRDDKKLRWENLSFGTSGKLSSWILSGYSVGGFKCYLKSRLERFFSHFQIKFESDHTRDNLQLPSDSEAIKNPPLLDTLSRIEQKTPIVCNYAKTMNKYVKNFILIPIRALFQ
jgi:hypothetical protein